MSGPPVLTTDGPLKVLLVHERGEARGGTEVHLDLLREGLERRGARVLQVGEKGALPPGESARRAVEEAAAALDGVDVVHFHSLGADGSFLDWIPRLRVPGRRLLSLHNFDFLCPGGEFYEWRRRRSCTRPFGLVTCAVHAFLDRCQSLRPARLFLNGRRCRRFSRSGPVFEAVLVASRFVRNRLRAGSFPADRVAVLPYFTRIPAFWTPAPASRTVLFVGRIERTKGLDLLLGAFGRLPGDARLLVAGEGSRRPEAEARARTLGLRDRVEFAGWKEGASLDRLYERAGVLALPSRWPEPFGIVGLEAMARARPVVSFDGGGVRDWLTDGRTGRLARPGDEADLADKLRSLLEEPETARAMGERARADAESRFSEERVVGKLLSLYAGTEAVSPLCAAEAPA